ncbi:hypothetical protein NTE29_004847 [Vibrio harveyi]|nr:hypothetical protein [Vibrio harveyi]
MISVRAIYQDVLGFYQDLNKSQKLYFVSAMLLIVQFFTRHLPEPANSTAFSLAMVFLVWAVVRDLLFLYQALWSKPLGKGVLLLGYTLLANLSLSLGVQYVNNAVGVEPYLYKHSVIFSAIMSVPVVAALVAAVAWFVIIGFGVLYLFFGLNIQQASEAGLLADILPANKENHFVLTTVVRIIAIGTICYTSYNLFSGYNERYNNFVIEQTKAFLYHFETIEFSRCKLENGTKFLPLNDKELVLATRSSSGEYTFKLSLCEPKLKQRT